MTVRDMAERTVAEYLGITVAEVIAAERAELATERATGESAEHMGGVFAMVQTELYGMLAG